MFTFLSPYLPGPCAIKNWILPYECLNESSRTRHLLTASSPPHSQLQERAVEAQNLALKKTPGLGSRIDITLTLVRIGLFFSDHKLVEENMAKAEKLIEEGGDWDRRNRLKVCFIYVHLVLLKRNVF